MSISTYSELQAAIQDFLNRDDLASVVPTFISLAEARINRDIRHWKQEKRVSTTLDEQYENLPSDYIEGISMSFRNGGQLTNISSAEMQRRKEVSTATGKPRYLRVIADQFEFYPAPGDALEIDFTYFAKIEALSDAAPSNWLLSDYPDVYLYGSLVQSAPYLDEDQRTATWAALYQSGVDAVNRDNMTGRYVGPLKMGAPR